MPGETAALLPSGRRHTGDTDCLDDRGRGLAGSSTSKVAEWLRGPRCPTQAARQPSGFSVGHERHWCGWTYRRWCAMLPLRIGACRLWGSRARGRSASAPREPETASYLLGLERQMKEPTVKAMGLHVLPRMQEAGAGLERGLGDRARLALKRNLGILMAGRAEATVLRFGQGHPLMNIPCVGHSTRPVLHLPVAEFGQRVFEHSLAEAVTLLTSADVSRAAPTQGHEQGCPHAGTEGKPGKRTGLPPWPRRSCRLGLARRGMGDPAPCSGFPAWSIDSLVFRRGGQRCVRWQM